MRHQAHHVAALVGDPRDRPVGPVGVVADVPNDDLALGLEAVQRRVVRYVAALAVLERYDDALAGRVAAGPGRRRVRDLELLVDAVELAVVVADQRPGKQVRLAQHLEAVADAQDRQPAAGRVDQRRHHRREPGDRPAAQVVAVGEAAGQDDRVDVTQRVVAVPEPDGLGAGQPHGAGRVAVVQRSREADDPDLHRCAPPPGSSTWTVKSSMTGLDSSVSAAERIWASLSSLTSPSTSSSNRLPWRTPLMPSKPSRGSACATALPWGSRISGLSMTSTTTRAIRALLRGSAGIAASLSAALVPSGDAQGDHTAEVAGAGRVRARAARGSG